MSRALARYRGASRRSFGYAKPIVIRTTKVVKHKKKHHRGGGAGGLLGGNRGKLMAGAFLLGMIQKSGIASSLPTIPVLGQTGTIGLAAHFLGKGMPLAEQVATVALSLACWQLAHDGHVVGEDGGFDVGQYVAGA